MFPSIAYLEWIEGRPAAATHDLGSSDLRPTPGGEVEPAALDGLSAPADATLESLLADAYDLPESRLLVTAGATHAYVLAVATALDAHDAADEDGEDPTARILVEKPGYEPHVATPRGLGGVVDRFVRTPDDWALEPERVAAATREDTALVVTSNRHNPTGVRADRDPLDAVADASPARLLVDEVYAPYGAGDGAGPLGGVTAAGLPNTVVTNSLTKFCGLGGLRIGWLVADQAFVEQAQAVSRHFAAVAQPSRALARRALANLDVVGERARDLAVTNHRLLADFVAGRADLDGAVPENCPFALLSHPAGGEEVTEAAWERDLLVVPGRFFGVPESFRVSLGHEPEHSEAALAVLGEVLDEL
jgi:aspartate/methionine/tyrosine aminotransferase